MALAKERMGGGLSAGTARALGGAYVSITAAGSAQGSATAVKASMVLVGSADGTKGVILPAGEVGDKITIINNSTSSLKVYPDSGAAITVPGTGLGSANTAYTQTTYAVCEYVRFTSTQWTVNQSAFVDGVAEFTTVTADAIVGGDSSLGVTGQAAAQGGAVAVAGGTSSTSGNAGGAVTVTGGTPGATGAGGAVSLTAAAGGATSGIGGAANITAGAGTAGNASGGSVVVTAGAKHGTGLDGGIFNRGRSFFKTPTPETATDNASLTDAQMLSGILVATPTAAAAYTVRTGTQLKAALPATLAADDSFDLTIINIGGTGDDITLTAASDITIVGDPVVRPSADSGTEQAGQGTFRFRYTTGVTFIAYRIS